MTAREWKPGDVALVTFDGDRTAVAVYSTGAGARVPVWEMGTGYLMAHRIESIRPVVVIDPEDREQVERLLSTYHAQYPVQWSSDLDQTHVDNLQAALREFANPTPPKPEEPTGLGAVVERSDGKRWVRGDKGWTNLDASGDYLNWSSWEGLNVYAPVVRVLSEGVTQ